MLLTQLFQILRGYLTISVTGLYPERFLNVCASRGILIWNVFPCSSTVLRCCISIRGFRLLPPIARKTNVRIKILHKKGLPIICAKYKKRKSFLVGVTVFLLLFVFLNQFIWKIEIVGCETVSVKAVEENLATCGLKIGSFRPFINENNIKNKMLIAMPELAWIWADKSGSKVTVQVKERIPVPEIYNPHDFCNIIAAKAGVIDAMIVKYGSPMVTLGDSVKAGDILVSGLLVSDKGAPPRMVQADAEMYARVWYEKTKAFSLWSPIQTETGNKDTKYTLHFFGHDLKLYRNIKPKFSEYAHQSKTWELSFFGKYLGIGFSSDTFTEQTTTYEKLTAESVIESGILELQSVIDEMTGPNSERKEIRSNHSIIDEDTVEVTVVAEYVEDIAQKVSLKTPTQEEAENEPS